jgi:hypothetical protein
MRGLKALMQLCTQHSLVLTVRTRAAAAAQQSASTADDAAVEQDESTPSHPAFQRPVVQRANTCPVSLQNMARPTITRENLQGFYHRHGVAKTVEEVDEILDGYGQDELSEALMERYNEVPVDSDATYDATPEPSAQPDPGNVAEDMWATSAGGSDAAAASTGMMLSRDQLVAFYSEHDPSKIDSVDELLEAYEPQELYDALAEHYGLAAVAAMHEQPQPDGQLAGHEQSHVQEPKAEQPAAPPSRPTLTTAAVEQDGSGKTNREMLVEFYTKHKQTSKIANIDQLLLLDLEELKKALHKRYDDCPPLKAPRAPESPNRQRLINYYQQHDPSKVDKVDQILELPHKRVVAALTKKYGADPGLESNAKLLMEFYNKHDEAKASADNIERILTAYTPRQLTKQLAAKYGEGPALMGTAELEYEDDGICGGCCSFVLLLLALCMPLALMSFYAVCFTEAPACAVLSTEEGAAAAGGRALPPSGQRADSLGCFCDDLQHADFVQRASLPFTRLDMSVLVMGAARDIVLKQLPSGVQDALSR